MARWVYKCNAKDQPHQVCYGDWDYLFKRPKRATEWGQLDLLPDLKQLKVGDQILAYQTDLNEFVGVATVKRVDDNTARVRKVYLQPDPTYARFDVKVRQLKRDDPKVAEIPAFKTRRIATLYKISGTDARILLKAAQNALT